MKEVKTTTIYSEDIIKSFLRIFYFERIKNIRIILNILIVILILYFFINIDNSNVLDYIAFIFALFGILELNTSMMPSINYKRIKNRKNSILNTKIKYVFKKNNFQITTDKDEYIDYDKLYKVINTKDAYYLYINKNRAFIVDKNNLKDGDITILNDKFKEKVPIYKER